MTCFEFIISKEPTSLDEDVYILVVCKGMSLLAIRSPKISWETFHGIVEIADELRKGLLKKLANERLYGAYYELKMVLIFTPEKPDTLSHKMLAFAESVIGLPIKLFVGFPDIPPDFSEFLSIPEMV
jgi:hypothetical protein